MMEICTIGGFSRTEGNSVAVKIDDEVVILDMGLSMSDYVAYTEDREDLEPKTYKELLRVKAVPDYGFIDDWKHKVKAIIPSHGHLDHVGAIPFAASVFAPVPVISTPYTIEVLKTMTRDEGTKIRNKFIPVPLNSSYRISGKVTAEFIYVTHSIPHTAIVVLHTPYGKIMYANDFKLDEHPVIGQKPNYSRLKQLGKEGIDLLIINCLYAHLQQKCPSESVAKEMLKDVMLGVQSDGKAMIVTTFSSHIARLKSIIELGRRLNRKIVFFGRSLDKYVRSAERLQMVDYGSQVEMVRQREQIAKMVHKIAKEGKEKYLIVCTGHQGEPKAVLSRLARSELDFPFTPGDIVIFSCNVIPVEVNIRNRERLEQILKARNVRIFSGVHVSGHGAREDHRDLLELVKPKQIIPIHAEPAKGRMLAELAAQLGFMNTQVMEDGKRMAIK